ncbi:MAG: hypothetical protein U1E05_09860 [Patescibacteria group bacterium]|nr:hypothetical protein [Patescibacteria group bacterium]
MDVSQPAEPKLISHYDSVEMATGIWVSGDLGFIATRCYGVEIIDVSDPARVRHVSTLKTGEAQSCWARDGRLYIGDWHPKKLLVADVRNPREPVIVAHAQLPEYARFETHRARGRDISDFDHPKPLREYHLFGHPGACDFWQGRLVIPAAYQGLLVERTAAR